MGLNDDANLLLLAKFDEAPGELTAVNSANPGTNDGTVGGGASIDFAADGKFGNCLTRTGADDKVYFGSLGLPSNQDQSFAFFYRIDAGTDQGRLFVSQDGSAGGLGLYIKPSNPSMQAIVGIANYQLSVTLTDLTDGEWHHLAVVYNSVAVTITYYYDGNNVGTDETVSGIGDWDSTKDTTLWYSGSMDASADDVRVYSRVLTEAEILTLATDPYPVVSFNPMANYIGA